jgi:DNA polymerase/3'-5' exonuclease PolX
MIVEHKGVQVDFYWARQESFGTYWMCRTGSREHNIWLAEIAKEAGGKWHPYVGLHLNHRVIAQTEADIYGALDLPFLDPATDRDLPRLHRVRPGHPLPR